MDYEKLMLKIKDKHFPELKDVNIKVKPLWILDLKILDKISYRPSMYVVGKNIYYNENMIKRKKYSNRTLRTIFAHELAHVVQSKRFNWIKIIIHAIKYYVDRKYTSKIEKEADRIVIKKGFGKDLIRMYKISEKNSSKTKMRWVKKVYYSSKDLEKLVYSKK